MRKLTYVLGAILLMMASAALAEDPTADLLAAEHVKHYIRIGVVTDPDHPDKQLIEGAADSFDDNDLGPLTNTTFASKGAVAIYIANFNPLTQVWTVKATSSPDPNYAAIKQFLDDLKPLQDSLKTSGTQAGQAAAMTNQPGMPAVQANACKRLRDLIDTANNALNEPIDVQLKAFRDSVKSAVGVVGVKNARDKTKDLADALDKANEKARTTLTNIRKEFGTFAGTQSGSCALLSDILIDYIEVTGKAEQTMATKAALAKALREINKTSLDPYAESGRWRGRSSAEADLTNLVFTSVTPTFENQFGVEATMKSRSIDVKDSEVVTKTEDTGSTAHFTMRRDTAWVTERAAAMIYNQLKYPKYGTTVKDGKTVVQRVNDTQPIDGAIMLNLIPRFGRPSSVYPMLQIGVSSAKEFPGFLAGLGLRFAAPVAFSISAGGMITRYKDLDRNLHVDDVVTGTNDIDKHLQYKTSPIALYGAIQLKF
jgi:hypothetical protein